MPQGGGLSRLSQAGSRGEVVHLSPENFICCLGFLQYFKFVVLAKRTGKHLDFISYEPFPGKFFSIFKYDRFKILKSLQNLLVKRNDNKILFFHENLR